MTIYSYIDYLLDSWCDWNRIFLTSNDGIKGNSLNEILGSIGSSDPSRAKEMFRIGLLKYELSLGDKAIHKLKNNINIQSELGFISALIYRSYKENPNSIKLRDAYHSLCSIFSIIQSETVNHTNFSINSIIFKLLEKYPCPNHIDKFTWIRYILSAFYCDLESKK